jgi:hypothetical protein
VALSLPDNVGGNGAAAKELSFQIPRYRRLPFTALFCHCRNNFYFWFTVTTMIELDEVVELPTKLGFPKSRS